jgi:hypothetical protein
VPNKRPASGVDAIVQAAETDLAPLEVFHFLDQVFVRATQAVQAPDDQGVAGAHEGGCFLEVGSLGLGAALIWSVKSFSQPAWVRASAWRSRFCSLVETRA